MSMVTMRPGDNGTVYIRAGKISILQWGPSILAVYGYRHLTVVDHLSSIRGGAQRVKEFCHWIQSETGVYRMLRTESSDLKLCAVAAVAISNSYLESGRMLELAKHYDAKNLEASWSRRLNESATAIEFEMLETLRLGIGDEGRQHDQAKKEAGVFPARKALD